MGTVVQVETAVAVPADITFKWFTDFSHYPRFMRSVEQVFPVEGHPARFRFVYTLAGIPRRYSIDVAADPQRRTLDWVSASGPRHRGHATVTPAGDDAAAVTLELELELDALSERIALASGLITTRARADLRRFARFVEDVHNAADPSEAKEIADGEESHRTPLQWLFDAVFPTDESPR
ncbi:SRPBCC family protein [Amycolatopsis sp. NPDC049159]|uniref:SRPBCC family protein n=1 Tax=Amycolatopsis sp. NPDC049159 TaxID=3157210 RepID=UPI0033F78703